jgi:hypothetical protein
MTAQGPAVRDSIPRLTLEQLLPAYREGIASPNIEVARTAIEILWQSLRQATKEASLDT